MGTYIKGHANPIKHFTVLFGSFPLNVTDKITNTIMNMSGRIG